jgi:hypothetical protein
MFNIRKNKTLSLQYKIRKNSNVYRKWMEFILSINNGKDNEPIEIGTLSLTFVMKTRFNLQEKFLMTSQIKNFRNQRPQRVIKKTRKIRAMKILTMLMWRQVR